ncbi:MAG TPA: LysR family transcriptional regulator [Casimicrobiaceae bacterium]|nr:LysR family transcriptional regulator [Casimicrobiaceae bacterium]
MRELDISTLDLNLLVLLEALFASSSITQAGDRVGLSQPAASRALARLRAMLGDPLFVRGATGLAATRRAEALQAPLARALAEIRSIVAPPRFEPRSARGNVRLLMPDGEAVALVPALLALLKAQAPGLDLNLLPRGADALPRLAAADADVAIGVFETAPAGFRRQRLYADTMVSVLRRGHPALKRGLTLARFVELSHALITITGEGGGPVDAALASRGLARRIALRIPSFLAAPLVVARSDLVVTMPRSAATAFAAIAPVALVPPPLPIPGFTVSQLWHERLQADARHAWLRKTIAEAARTRA